MTKVYTDASVSTGRAVVSAIALNDDKFLGFQCRRHDGISTSLVGELIGIREAIGFIIELGLLDKDMVVIYTDEAYCVELLTSDKRSKVEQVNQLVDEVFSMLQDNEIQIEHFKGHQLAHNPNKVVDIVSRSLLRSALKERVK